MQSLIKIFALLITALLIAPCESADLGVKGAKGETPVKYVICSISGTNCFVAARFDELEACESYKHWHGMLCDKVSKTGEMLCRTNTGRTISTAYCTR